MQAKAENLPSKIDPRAALQRLKRREADFLLCRLVRDSDTEAAMAAGVCNRATAGSWASKRKRRNPLFAAAYQALWENPSFRDRLLNIQARMMVEQSQAALLAMLDHPKPAVRLQAIRVVLRRYRP